MKRIHRAGLVVGMGLSAVLASSAPSPNASAETPACPTVAYEDNYIIAEQTPHATKADRIVTGLGAFMLGVLDSKCRDGEATTSTQGNEVTYKWSRDSQGIISDTTYHLTVSAQKGPDGKLRAGDVSAFGIEKDNTFWDRDVSVQAEDVDTGWLVSVKQPFETDAVIGGDTYSFTGNTGASIAERQAGDIVDLAKVVLKDALR